MRKLHHVEFDGLRYDGRTPREWLPDVVADIVAACSPLKIILFGSLARGDDRPGGDIDLLVVLPNAPLDRKRTLQTEIRGAVQAPAPLDVHVTDPNEISRRAHLTGTLLQLALREGVVLYERSA